MGADQITAMCPAIGSMLERSHGDDVWCANVSLRGDPARFVQVLSNALNVAYPIAAPPAHVLSKEERLGKLAVMEWKANEFVTLELPEGASAADIAHLVDGLFHLLFGCGEDYAIDVSVERLA